MLFSATFTTFPYSCEPLFPMGLMSVNFSNNANNDKPMELFHQFVKDCDLHLLSMEEIDKSEVSWFEDRLIFKYDKEWDMKTLIFDTEKRNAVSKDRRAVVWATSSV